MISVWFSIWKRFAIFFYVSHTMTLHVLNLDTSKPAIKVFQLFFKLQVRIGRRQSPFQYSFWSCQRRGLQWGHYWIHSKWNDSIQFYGISFASTWFWPWFHQHSRKVSLASSKSQRITRTGLWWIHSQVLHKLRTPWYWQKTVPSISHKIL